MNPNNPIAGASPDVSNVNIPEVISPQSIQNPNTVQFSAPVTSTLIPTSKSNSLFWVIISSIVLVLILIAGYFIFASKNTNENVIQSVASSTSDINTQEKNVVADIKKEWLIYTDQDKLFSIKYPSDWTVLSPQTDPSGINKVMGFVSPKSAGVPMESAGVLVTDLKNAPQSVKSLEAYSEGNYANLKSSPKISNLSKLEDTTFAGLPAKKVSYSQSGQNGELVIEAVWTIYKDKVFGVSYVSDKVTKQRYSDDVKEMISSMQISK